MKIYWIKAQAPRRVLALVKHLGIDAELVEKLGAESPIPVTYAGGASSLSDLQLVTELGKGRVDLTIGSALDIFGGSGVRYEDAVLFNRRQMRAG